MPQPSFAEYTEALRWDLAGVLSDPLLARGRLLTHGPGLPVALSGNFALTFVIEVDDRKYALRCFHKPTDGLEQRYEAITRRLRAIASPYLVEARFEAAGITTESGSHPVVRMEWAEGRTLGTFVAAHLADASALRQLRDTLRRAAANLGVCGIAHGDIQPSNVIVKSPTRLKLIDYDGMFVPELRSLASAEIGQRNFQHPGRCDRHFDERLDAFSFAVIDLALDALSKRPELWAATGSGDDAFILRAEDFADPARSPAFQALARVPGLERRVRDCAAICASPYERVPRFGDLIAGRNIPDVTVVFSADPALAGRRRYVSPHPVVEAANFARCCSHVGDRVELVGQVARVVRSHTPRLESTYLRVEFDERGRDMACLKIWPGTEVSLAEVPDASWVGTWLSATGLVEPVARGHSGAERQRDVSITVADGSQLRRITEAEARYRLQGRHTRTQRSADATGAIRTDPVVTDAAPRITAAATRRPHGGTRPAVPRTRRAADPPPTAAAAGALPATQPPSPVQPGPAPLSPAAPPPSPPAVVEASTRRRPATAVHEARRPLPVASIAGILIACAATALVLLVRPREVRHAQDPATRPPLAAAATGSVADPPRPAAAVSSASPAVRVESQQALYRVRLPLATVAGSLSIGTSSGSQPARATLLLDGRALATPRDDVLVLAHQAKYTDREIITGFATCSGPGAGCGLRQPFWLVLRPEQPPITRTAPGLWVGSAPESIVARDGGVRVDLGTWDGERRTAVLTTAGDVTVLRQPAPIRALASNDCAVVIRSLEACAAGRDCSSISTSARPIPRRIRARLAQLHHQTTGLDAAAFRGLCVRSCELGLTPSAEFIRRNACSGARRGQWNPDDPAADLIDAAR